MNEDNIHTTEPKREVVYLLVGGREAITSSQRKRSIRDIWTGNRNLVEVRWLSYQSDLVMSAAYHARRQQSGRYSTGRRNTRCSFALILNDISENNTRELIILRPNIVTW